MRERVDQLGVAEPEIQRSGEDQIDVSLPDVENADEAAQQVGTTAQLFFYDWETNVLGAGLAGAAGPGGHRRPGGGPGAARLSLYDAVKRAAKLPGARLRRARRRQFYLVDTKAKKVLAGRTRPRPTSPGDRQQEHRARRQPGGPRGHAGHDRRRASSRRTTTASNRWYVLRDRPALSGTDIRNPEQNFDQGPGGSGQPIVTFDFTDKGRTSGRRPRARSPSAARSSIFRRRPVERLPALRDRAGQRADLGAVHRLPGEPRRHRRAHGLEISGGSRSTPPSGWPTC